MAGLAHGINVDHRWSALFPVDFFYGETYICGTSERTELKADAKPQLRSCVDCQWISSAAASDCL